MIDERTPFFFSPLDQNVNILSRSSMCSVQMPVLLCSQGLSAMRKYLANQPQSRRPKLCVCVNVFISGLFWLLVIFTICRFHRLVDYVYNREGV
jgi:hypothetical protein